MAQKMKQSYTEIFMPDYLTQMNKSPRQLREDIERISQRIKLVMHVLERNTEERIWGLGDECHKTAIELKKLLEENIIPDEYKVAVVGRFKAGKSAFVNELLGRKLAGEETGPETAAVTTFRDGPIVKATLQLVNRKDWNELNGLYSSNPNDPDAQRVAHWYRFIKKDGKTSQPQTGDIEIFNLDALEKQFVTEPSYRLEIPLDDSAGKKGETTFRRELKKFTSGAKPHHCLCCLASARVAKRSPWTASTLKLWFQLSMAALS